ncbi:MAG: hypothetical protein KZQ83_18090 [gamma proteobacterium symbiont of Taylorina sp.]|nr:hypothetical protein [gamma proteobacterium symbiont of Taylorina sp.]
MTHSTIEQLYYSLNGQEKYLLQVRRQEFERQNNIIFINLESYVNHLALEVVNRERCGEFLPRSIEEAKAGHHL